MVDILAIIFLFLCGLVSGLLAILIGLKKPLKLKRIGSLCSNCNEQYEWYQLIPVVSFFFFRNNSCPYCHKKLSIFFPILEFLSGVLFSLSYILYGFSYELLIVLMLIFLSINIFVSDFKHYVILDGPLLIIGILILLFKLIFFNVKVFLLSLLSGLIIFTFMLFVRFLGNKMFKQESIGGGDIKLSMLFGFTLGLRLSIVSLIIGAFLAFPYAIYYSLKGKDKEIPFGPFLILGLDITFLFMDYINLFLSIIFK